MCLYFIVIQVRRCNGVALSFPFPFLGSKSSSQAIHHHNLFVHSLWSCSLECNTYLKIDVRYFVCALCNCAYIYSSIAVRWFDWYWARLFALSPFFPLACRSYGMCMFHPACKCERSAAILSSTNIVLKRKLRARNFSSLPSAQTHEKSSTFCFFPSQNIK